MSSETNSRPSQKNHYETLGLEQNCTEKQVKAAFITLSKVHHPDLNPSDPGQKEKFVRIYEAYEVLSRPHRRVAYDSDLRYQEKVQQQSYQNGQRVWTNAPQYRVWRDESIWSMRDQTRQDFSGNKPYYGIKGVNRVSNNWIAGGTVLVMVLGVLMHVAAFKLGGPFSETRLDTKDERLARELFTIKRKAAQNGNDYQLDGLADKLGRIREPGRGTK